MANKVTFRFPFGRKKDDIVGRINRSDWQIKSHNWATNKRKFRKLKFYSNLRNTNDIFKHVCLLWTGPVWPNYFRPKSLIDTKDPAKKFKAADY